MSIAAALTGVVVLLLRCIKKIPRRFVYLLWAIPLLRMIFPASIGSRYSLMELLSNLGIRTVTIPSPYPEIIPDMHAMNSIGFAQSYYPTITFKVQLLEDVFTVASAVWLIVALALLLTFAILYFLTIHELRDAVPLRENIYVSHKIQSPAVYGILRPKIIIPEGYENKDLTFPLLHERAHIKRRDNLWRIIAFTVAAVYWFNPLSWVFLKCFITDMELSCDEKVLSKCGEENRKAYALALVDFAESRNVFASAFGGTKIRLRVDNILSYKKLSVLAVLGLIAFAAAIAYVLLTNAA